MRTPSQNPVETRRASRLRAHGIAIVVLISVLSTAAHAQSVSVQKTSATQIRVSWPSGLGLVQPQKATNLAANAWQDFGAAISANELVDAVGGMRAFYRLRFVPPAIAVQPQSQSVAAGASVNFSVTATGTAPLNYQWRRNETNLVGQTNALLALSSVSVSDAGNFTVLVSNRAGAVTSAVATLTLSGPAATPRGVFMGNFTGQTNGGLAMMVSSNRIVTILGHNMAQSQGVLATNVALGSGGNFDAALGQGASITGTFSPDASTVSGTLTATNGSSAAFTAALKPEAGVHQASAGFYAGNFTGLLAGNLYAIMAADGVAFAYLSSPIVSGGAFGSVDASNNFAASTTYSLPGSTVPSIIQIAAKLNPATRQFSGTYGLPGLTLGTFALMRVAAP